MAAEQEESFGIIPLKYEEDHWSLFIILHAQGNHWGFPKGHPEEGEKPLESAVRELEEETGLKVQKLLSEDPFVEHYTFHRKGNKVEKTASYFPAIVSGALILQPEEIRDGKWLTFEEADKQLTFPEARSICKKLPAILSQYE